MGTGSLPLAAIVRSSDRVAERQQQGTYHGDEDQIADVDRYCKARRVAYVLLPPELDVSGGKPIEERPSLSAAIEGVESGIYSGVVAANLKRLTRSRSGIQIWERVEAAGGHVHTAAEQIDTSTPANRFMRDVFLADAVREREEHADRHAKRRAETVKAGMWRQRQVPRGYQFSGPAVDGRFRGAARKLVPSAQADEVRQAASDVLTGVPISRIAERIGMTPSGVRAMLRNRVYLGELRDGPNVNPGAHEPIIDGALFDAVGRALASNPRPPRRHDGPALLAGLVRCAGCGHVMSRGASKVPVYNCQAIHSGERCPEPASVTLALLDAHVERIALIEFARFAAVAQAGDTLADAQAALDSAENEMRALVKAVTAAGLDDRDFAEELRVRKAAVEDARGALEAERALRPVIPAAGSGIEVWRGFDAVERNSMLRRTLAAVIVQRAGGRGSRRALGDRVRVLALGTPLAVAGSGRGGRAGGIVPVPLPDFDLPGVLRVPPGE